MSSHLAGSRSSARTASSRSRPERSKANSPPKRQVSSSSFSATTAGKHPRPSQIKVTTLSFRNHPSVDAISVRNTQSGQSEWFEVDFRGERVKDTPLRIQSGTEEDGSLWMELTDMPSTEPESATHSSRSRYTPQAKPAYTGSSSPLSSAGSAASPTKSPHNQSLTKKEDLLEEKEKKRHFGRNGENSRGSTRDPSSKELSVSSASLEKKSSTTKTHVTILHQPHSAQNGRSPFNIKPTKLQPKASTPKPDVSVSESSKESEEKKKRRREKDQMEEDEVAELKNRKKNIRSRTTHFSSDDDNGDENSLNQNHDDTHNGHEDDTDDDDYGSRRKSTKKSKRAAEDKIEHPTSTLSGEISSVPLKATTHDKDDLSNSTNPSTNKVVDTVDRPSKKLKSAHPSIQVEDSASSSSSTTATKKLGSSTSTSQSASSSSKKDRVTNLKKIGGSSSNSAVSSPVAGTSGSSPAGGRPSGPTGSKGGPTGKKTGGGGTTKKEPGVLDASFYSSLLKPAVEKATTASITSHILEKETVERKAAAAEMEKLKQVELAKIRASFTANGPTLDLESQANDMQTFSTWMIKNVPAPQARIHTHGGMNNIWEAGLDIKLKTQTDYREKHDRGEIGPGRTRDQNGLMPLPKTAEESDDLNFAFVREMEGKWGDRVEVEKYLNDSKWFPFGRGMA